MSYDASNIVFVPARFQIGWMRVDLPTTLPAYSVSVMTE
jgi:hypothetical protein